MHQSALIIFQSIAERVLLKLFVFLAVEMAGGINNFSPVIGTNANLLFTNLKQLIAANPEYITQGIPTNLIQQMWKKETPKVSRTRFRLAQTLQNFQLPGESNGRR